MRTVPVTLKDAHNANNANNAYTDG